MHDTASELPQGTVTFLFTDIERSTELTRRFGAEFGRMRSEHRRVLRESFVRHGGYEIDTAGDGFFVVFERAGDAVTAAIDGQRAVLGLPEHERGPLRVRMGLHTAEPHRHEDGYIGVGVSRAARICAAGHGDQILISNATAGIIEDLELDEVALLDLGLHRLKDMPAPQRLFQLVAGGLPSEFAPPHSLDVSAQRPSIVTLLLTDVDGWQHVLRTLGDEGATAVARANHEIVLDVVESEGGYELEVVADTVLAGFERARDALRAAVAVRERLHREPWYPEDDKPAVRIAIHSGRLADPTARHLGTVGFRCVALNESAEPGQILVSHATEALLEGELSEFQLRDLGERVLRQIERPVHVFEVAS